MAWSSRMLFSCVSPELVLSSPLCRVQWELLEPGSLAGQPNRLQQPRTQAVLLPPADMANFTFVRAMQGVVLAFILVSSVAYLYFMALPVSLADCVQMVCLVCCGC